MKRSVLCLLVILQVFWLMPVHAFAAETDSESQVVRFEDGSYLVITMDESQTWALGTKSGTKTSTYTDSDGTIRWKAVLSATFTYTGTLATCEAASCEVTVYANNWYLVSKTVEKSGNTATAAITMGRKLLGVTIAKDTYDLSITCDKNGNLS